jgi:GxxExxY protein
MNLAGTTGAIVDSGYCVHSTLGPGLLESAYHKCLAHELRLRGYRIRSKCAIPVEYKGLKIPVGYQADLIVDDAVIIEVKTADRIHPIHEAQLLTYLRLTGITVGLILNFHETLFRDGITRLVNNYKP